MTAPGSGGSLTASERVATIRARSRVMQRARGLPVALTRAEVEAIRRAALAGESVAMLAARYGVTTARVRRCAHNRSIGWKRDPCACNGESLMMLAYSSLADMVAQIDSGNWGQPCCYRARSDASPPRASQAALSPAALRLSARRMCERAMRRRAGPADNPAMQRWRAWVCIAAIASSSGACAAARARPDVHQDGWLLVETEHIHLRTDLDREDAIERARQLERYWQVLATMYAVVVPGKPAPPGPFHAIHFDRCLDLMRFEQRSEGRGFVFTSRFWMSESIAVTCERQDDATLLHELAHIFNGHHFPGMPVWVNEGLATYYESLTVEDGRALVGRVPGWKSHPCQGRSRPRLDALRRMSYEAFHQEYQEGCNYFSAWKLVHLLTGTEPELHYRFRLYLAGLGRAMSNEEAWTRAFAGEPPGRLAAAYEGYEQQRKLAGWGARYRWSEPALPRVRPLRPAEAHVLWLNLLAQRGKTDLVHQQLAWLAAADPSSPEPLYWRAVILVPSDAAELLRRYLSRRPDDERGWRALVVLEMEQALPAGHLGLEPLPPAGLAALEPDVHQLVARARDPSSFNQIGWYFAMRQQSSAGLPFAVRAIRAAPRCGDCWDTLALLLFQAGKAVDAVRAQERAVALLGEATGRNVLARLRGYRAAAAEAPAAAAR